MSKAPIPLPSLDVLNSLFDFDGKNLIWKEGARKNIRAGRIAGSKAKKGRTSYRYVEIFGTKYMAHRIVWKMHFGSDPKGFIDHIDGNGLNNAISNIRDTTAKENSRNARRQSSKSGICGVHSNGSSWCAQIVVDGKSNHLGSFATKELAASARARAARKYGFNELHGSDK